MGLSDSRHSLLSLRHVAARHQVHLSCSVPLASRGVTFVRHGSLPSRLSEKLLLMQQIDSFQFIESE